MRYHNEGYLRIYVWYVFLIIFSQRKQLCAKREGEFLSLMALHS